MSIELRSAFLLLRRAADLERVSEELAAYLAVLRRRSQARGLAVVQGIWLDEDGVANLPRALVLPDATGGGRTVPILEASGVNGIWMLCWLEQPARSIPNVDLVAALLACFDDEDVITPAVRFIPVFADGAPASSVARELKVLRERYPGLVLAPIGQGLDGRLSLPSAQPRDQGAVA